MVNRKILVIGGTGTMGKPLVDSLLSEDCEVFVVCRHGIGDKRDNCHYFYGDAKNISFMSSVVSQQKYDCIVDFCLYSAKEFQLRYEYLLNATSHYICLSSAAVYSDAPSAKTEGAQRYMESAPPEKGNKKYNWYCYEKARIEDILTSSNYNNWTIVRPGITMGPHHYFWGFWYDEEWQYRIFHHQKVLVPKDLLPYKASISYGRDVAILLMAIIESPTSYQQIYNVTSDEVYSWAELLDIWQDICHRQGHDMKIQYLDNSCKIYGILPWKGREYGYVRARLLDRTFDSTKAQALLKENKLTPSIKGCLEKWISDYFKTPPMHVRRSKIPSIAKIDILTHETTNVICFKSKLDYCLYIYLRYVPFAFALMDSILKLRKMAFKNNKR